MKIRVWDIPTRLFHWLFIFFFVAALLSSENEWLLENHATAGYIVLFLVFFRLIWGFFGNEYAKFSGFLKGWSAVREYVSQTIKSRPARYLGHNPAVGWAIMVMLGLTIAIALSGIITYSGEEEKGLFAGVFSFNTALISGEVHDVLSHLMLFIIGGHLLMALIHDLVFKENIIISMITGMKEDQETWKKRVSHPQPARDSVFRAAVWGVALFAAGIIIMLLPSAGKGVYREPMIVNDKGEAIIIPPNEKWVNECGTSCHGTFHPTLLPKQSWIALMDGLDSHFGDDATLDEETKKEILDYLLSSSGEFSRSEASRKILRSIKGEAPVRITETPYWKKKHSDLDEEVFKRKAVSSKSNCVACHPGADKGSFEDRDINVPK